MNKTTRIASIDVYRALTMFLMIWVNDFWTLENIPKWLQHAKSGEDYLGFSDLIFPWFLFIVGLAIPFAIDNRIKKGQSNLQITWHIITRSLALLVMGVFLVNAESYHAEATGMAKSWFTILMISGFFLIWNVYPKATGSKKYLFLGLQFLGVLVLVYLGLIYRGTTYDSDAVVRMQTRWWGILGLIGWTYMIAAPLYLFFKKTTWLMWIFWLFFIGLNIIGNAGIAYNIFPNQDSNWVVGNGAFHAFAFGGIVTAGFLRNKNNRTGRLYLMLLLWTVITLGAGFLSRNFFIISKISATPPWVFFSLSTGFALYAILHWLVDNRGKVHWFNIIKTAGTATLTCYLIPYFVYSFRSIFSIHLNDFLTTGWIGLLKSVIYSLLVIFIARLLVRLGIKLKI